MSYMLPADTYCHMKDEQKQDEAYLAKKEAAAKRAQDYRAAVFLQAAKTASLQCPHTGDAKKGANLFKVRLSLESEVFQ